MYTASFRTFAKIGLVALLALAAAPAAAGAQDARTPHVGLVLAGGVTGVPDPLGARCGTSSGSSPGLEGGASVLVRSRRWLVLQGDVRAMQGFAMGCKLVLLNPETSYDRISPRKPLVTTSARVGVETPPGTMLLRATAGLGAAWGSPVLPVGVLALAAGSRGRHVRFLAEVERFQARIPADEVRRDPGQPATSRPIVLYPSWYSFRIGVELPLAR